MEKVLHFIANHWVLVALFAMAFIWLIIEEARSKGMLGSNLTPQAAVGLINRENAVVLDIRDAGAFGTGHIVGSMNIPMADLERNTERLEPYKQRPLIIVCAAGQKANSVMQRLKNQGYEKIYALAGGIHTWKKENMPLVKD